MAWRRRIFGGTFVPFLAGYLVAGSAWADVVTAESTTIVSSRVEARDGVVYRSTPFLQLVTLRGNQADNPVLADLEMEVSGWGELTMGDTRGDRRTLGDVDVAYVGGAVLDRRIRLRLGRHFVVPGSARVRQLDGVSVEARIADGVGVSSYVGLPVAPRFAERLVDFSAGGRAFYRVSVESEFGVSIASMLGNQAGLDRREVGLDGRQRMGNYLTVFGLARYSLTEARLSEGDLGISTQPIAGMDLSLDYRRIAPDLFLPRYSIFSVFARETRDEIGGFLGYAPARWLSLQGSFHNSYTVSGWGTDTTGKITLKPDHRGFFRMGVESRRLYAPTGGYWMGRLFARLRLSSAWSISATASRYAFLVPVNDQTSSLEGSVGLVGDLSRDFRLVVSGSGGSSPFLREQFNVLAKLVYGGGRIQVEERRP